MTAVDDRYKQPHGLAPITHETLVAYIETGRRTGDFLYHVLTNDLRACAMVADEENRTRLVDVVRWVYEYAPSVCWGDRKAVAAWMGHEGLKGFKSEPAVPNA